MEKQKRTRRSGKQVETNQQPKVEEKPKRTRTRKVTPLEVDKVVAETVEKKLNNEATPAVVNKTKKKDYTEFYKKYPWVVPGSVREATDEDKKVLPKCHGMVCTIKCVDTGKLRTINTQDAFQVKRTEEAAALFRKGKRNVEQVTKVA